MTSQADPLTTKGYGAQAVQRRECDQQARRLPATGKMPVLLSDQ